MFRVFFFKHSVVCQILAAATDVLC